MTFPPVRYCIHHGAYLGETCPGCRALIKKTLGGVPPASATQPPSKPAGLPHAKVTFDRAYGLIGGDRREAYGNYTGEAAYVADMWNAILKGGRVLPRHVPLMMCALKLVRQANGHRQDNLDDLCGYAGLAAELEAANPSPTPTPPAA